MKYKIKINYSTGNSFGSEDMESYVELSWDNIDVAKENLKFIKEHYNQYKELTSYSFRNNRTDKEIILENKDKEWFVYKPKLISKLNNCAIEEKHKKIVGEGNWEYIPDIYHAQYCLSFKTDDGKKMQISAFWCGYFEHLYSAEIEVDKGFDDMRIEF